MDARATRRDVLQPTKPIDLGSRWDIPRQNMGINIHLHKDNRRPTVVEAVITQCGLKREHDSARRYFSSRWWGCGAKSSWRDASSLERVMDLDLDSSRMQWGSVFEDPIATWRSVFVGSRWNRLNSAAPGCR